MSEMLWKGLAYKGYPNPQSLTDRRGRELARYESCKRLLDVIFVGLGLLVLSPLFLLLALVIKIDSHGPILFSQPRVGKQGELFNCWKFRSMVVNADAMKDELLAQNEVRDGPTFKIKRDPRITRVGRFIRKASIDELPQLWNVLLGDMSLVGPRPPVPQEVEQYGPYEMRRLLVKPGITCTWQVSGRSELPFAEQVRLDLEYIAQRSLVRDLSLLLRTVPAVLLAKGAC